MDRSLNFCHSVKKKEIPVYGATKLGGARGPTLARALERLTLHNRGTNKKSYRSRGKGKGERSLAWQGSLRGELTVGPVPLGTNFRPWKSALSRGLSTVAENLQEEEGKNRDALKEIDLKVERGRKPREDWGTGPGKEIVWFRRKGSPQLLTFTVEKGLQRGHYFILKKI